MNKIIYIFRIIFCAGLFVLSNSHASEEVELLNSSALKIGVKIDEIDKFISSDFTVLMKAGGDLNKDGIVDYVILLNEKKHISRNILIVLLADLSGFYKLVDKAFFISDKNKPSVYNDFTLLDVDKKGVLNIGFHSEFPAGENDVKYKIRFNGVNFELIGLDIEDLQRGPGETSYTSFNYLNNRTCRTREDLFGKVIEKEKCVKLNAKRKFILNELKFPDQSPINTVFGD